jgi:hypothetical protein
MKNLILDFISFSISLGLKPIVSESAGIQNHVPSLGPPPELSDESGAPTSRELSHEYEIAIFHFTSSNLDLCFIDFLEEAFLFLMIGWACGR